MKIIFTMLMLLTSYLTVAQTIEIDISGVRHSCTPMSSGPGRMACADLAYSGPFSREESVELCAGAINDAPARCALRAYRGPLSKEETVSLCRRAYSEGPVECLELAYRGPFSKEESILLCAGSRATVENAHCALRAYQGPYSKEEAIRMCKTRHGLVNRSMISGTEKENLEKLLKEVNMKAFKLNEYK
jgi:hypothetical protein